MAKTGANPDRRESFNFYQLQRAVEDRLSSYEGADRLPKMDPKEQSLRQLVEQFCNQQPARPGVHGGALMQQQSPTDQATVQSPAQGYKDWQNSTRAPFVLQDCRPPQGSQYPQDTTAFGQPQRDA